MANFWLKGWTLVVAKILKPGDEFYCYSQELNACVVPRCIWVGDGRATVADTGETLCGIQPDQIVGVQRHEGIEQDRSKISAKLAQAYKDLTNADLIKISAWHPVFTPTGDYKTVVKCGTAWYLIDGYYTPNYYSKG